MPDSCFPSYVTLGRAAFSLPTSAAPSSEEVTPPQITHRHRRSESLLDFALTGLYDAAALTHPAPLVFPDAFIEAAPTSARSESCKTFDQLTPEEFLAIASQIEADVLADHGSSAPVEYATPSDDAVVLNASTRTGPPYASSAPVRNHRRATSSLRVHPYHGDSAPASSLLPDLLSPNATPSATDFGYPVSWMNPGTPATVEIGPVTDDLLSPRDEMLMRDFAAATAAASVHPSRSHHAMPQYGQFICQWQDCDAPAFSTLPALAAHLLHRHVPRRRSQYPCLWTNCSRGGYARPFPKRHKLVAHLRSHTHERPFTCSTCGRAFAREDSRDAHARVHGEERVGPWGCSCQGGRVWRSWRGVRRHQATGTCTGVVQLATGQPVVVPEKRAGGHAGSTGADVDDDDFAGLDDDENEEEDSDLRKCDDALLLAANEALFAAAAAAANAKGITRE